MTLFNRSYTIARLSGSGIMTVQPEIQAFFDGMEDVAPFLFHSGTINVEIEFNINPADNIRSGLGDYTEYAYVDMLTQTDYRIVLYGINCLGKAEQMGVDGMRFLRYVIAHEFGHIAFLISEPDLEDVDEDVHEQYANQFAQNYTGDNYRLWRDIFE